MSAKSTKNGKTKAIALINKPIGLDFTAVFKPIIAVFAFLSPPLNKAVEAVAIACLADKRAVCILVPIKRAL